MRGRVVLGAGLVVLLSLPAAASAAVVLTTSPAAAWVPEPVLAALRPWAALMFDLVARLPPESLAGRLFYGSFAPLPALVGSAALAVHAALLGAPWAGLAVLMAWWTRREVRRARAAGARTRGSPATAGL